MIVNLDFETRSHVDLKVHGLDRYAKDVTTEVICMAYCTNGANIKLWYPESKAALPALVYDPATVFVAWNAAFEYNILREVLGIPVRWEQFVDSMALAGANNIPQSLEEAAIFTEVTEQKDPTGKRLINKLSKPLPDGTFNKSPVLLQQMYEYCRQDVRTEMAIAATLTPLTASEQALWVLTQRINDRGVPVDPVELQRAMEAVGYAKADVHREINVLTGGLSATQPAKLVAWLTARGVVAKDLTAETVEALLRDKNVMGDARRVLELRALGSSTSVAKFAKMMEIQSGGRIRNLFVYHGASTGRFASRGGLNLQNLPRPQIPDEVVPEVILRVLECGGFGSVPELASVVRSTIKAPTGLTFVDADFSSVENRVGVWIPNQKDKLQMFRDGLDEYKVFASTALYNVPYEEVTKEMRQRTKPAVLGCLFGQGKNGLIQYAAGMGVALTEVESERAVTRYRESYYAVKKCWYELDSLAVLAVQNPCTDFTIASKRGTLRHEKGVLWMTLPSGRRIAWQKPEVGEHTTPWGSVKVGVSVLNQNTFTRKWGRNVLIGPSIFQSLVQGTARDLLTAALTALDADGLDVIGHFHDEVLLLAPLDKSEGVLSRVISVMTTPPPWALDLPLAAEGWVDTRFRK